MKQLANSIAHQQQLKRLEHDREQQDSGMMLSPASLAAAFEAVPAAEEDDAVEPEVVQLRHQRQQEELNAAIQALVGVEVSVSVTSAAWQFCIQLPTLCDAACLLIWCCGRTKQDIR